MGLEMTIQALRPRDTAGWPLKLARVVLLGAAGSCLGAVEPDVVAVRLADGLSRPVFVTSPPGQPGRLFVVEQHSGQIRLLERATGRLNSVPFLTVAGLATGNEQGLLGLAFHPSYAENGLFYINLTVSSGATEVRRYQLSADDPDIADPASGQLVLSFAQPFANHNGGWMAFGPDGFLYIGTGDGGSAGDPGNRAQNLAEVLGKILRIDVDGDDYPLDISRNYAIPPSNPFAGGGGLGEIWAYGLRNPWRDGFDALTGDLYLGDVGQNAWEEIDYQPAASPGGENYGWNIEEGSHCYTDPACSSAGLVDPVYEYAHGPAPDGGYSIIGGYVYRGPIAALDGHYFFADFVTAQIWSFGWSGGVPTTVDNWTAALTPPVGSISQISSFGEDADGNLYVADLGGAVFKLVRTSSDACSGDSVVLQDWTAPVSQPRVCTATHSLATRHSVSLPPGADVRFSAPEVVLKPGFVVARGAVLGAGPP